jgi:hypothetical protein
MIRVYILRLNWQEEKIGKDTIGWIHGTLEASDGACVGVLSTLRENSSQLASSDEPMVEFLHAPDELKRRSNVGSQKTVAPDEPMICL